MPRDPDRQVGAAARAVGDHAQRQQRVLRRATRRTTNAVEQHDGGGERDDRQRVRPRSASRSSRSRRRARTGRRSRAAVPGQVDAAGGPAARWLTSSRSAAIAVGIAISRFTYRHQRQDSHSVRMPPSSRPTAAPPPAIAPKMPNALPRSAGSVNVVVSSASADGASSAPKTPCSARARDEHAERAGGAADRRGDGEAEQAADEGPLAAEQVAEAAAEQQQRAERQRVGGDDPLALVVGEAEVLLRAGQRDVHDRRRRARPSAGRCRSARGSASGARDGGCRQDACGSCEEKWRYGLNLRQKLARSGGLAPLRCYRRLDDRRPARCAPTPSATARGSSSGGGGVRRARRSTSRSTTSPPPPGVGVGHRLPPLPGQGRAHRRAVRGQDRTRSSRSRATRWTSRTRGRRSRRSCAAVCRAAGRGPRPEGGAPRAATAAASAWPHARDAIAPIAHAARCSARRRRAPCARTSATFDVPMMHFAVGFDRRPHPRRRARVLGAHPHAAHRRARARALGADADAGAAARAGAVPHDHVAPPLTDKNV